MNNHRGIGLLGGTFDPIHNGHVHLALAAYYALNLEAVHFIPAAQPLLRTSPVANETDRLEMVRLATATHDFLIADDREIKRRGDSYTIDTLADIRAEKPDVPLYLIIGVDQFSKFDQWKEWQKIPSLAHIIVSSRIRFNFSPSPELNTFVSRYQIDQPGHLQDSPSGHLFFLTRETLPISSTKIREKLMQGKDVSNLLPGKVWEYICQKRLYGIGLPLP